MSELQGPPSAEPAAEPVQDDTFTVLDLVLVLVRRRRLIVATTGIAAVVLLVYNILAMVMHPESPLNLLPNRYTATVTVSIADDSPDYGAVAASLLSQIPAGGGLADFAGLLSSGVSTDAGRAQALLVGREILDALAVQQGLVTDASGNGEILDARKRLTESLSSDYLLDSGLLVISYDHFHPEPAAAGLQFAVQKLRDKVHALTLERVLVRKAFLEERLAAVEQDRTAAQDVLIAFQREFGVVNLNAQSESALQHLTSLKTDLYRKEVELHSQIELLGENTAAVVRLRSEVDKLRTLTLEIEHGFVEFQESSIPLSELPALGVRYLDLATELSVHDTIYAFLRSQYESTRIEESAKEASFQIVEPVEVPRGKSRPRRSMICIIGTLAAFMVSVLAAFTLEYFRRAASNPAQRRQLDEIRQAMRLRT